VQPVLGGQEQVVAISLGPPRGEVQDQEVARAATDQGGAIVEEIGAKGAAAVV
jgi:hypothetical protein